MQGTGNFRDLSIVYTCWHFLSDIVESYSYNLLQFLRDIGEIISARLTLLKGINPKEVVVILVKYRCLTSFLSFVNTTVSNYIKLLFKISTLRIIQCIYQQKLILFLILTHSTKKLLKQISCRGNRWGDNELCIFVQT